MPETSDLPPFVLETEPSQPQQIGTVDLYLPTAPVPAPLVVLVHGGPMKTPPRLPPTRWPVYVGYSSLLRSQGAAVAMFNHGLLNGDDAAPGDLRIAIDTARNADGVDADRVVLWFFSGGGVLSPAYLNATPGWLRGLAFSYAVLDDDDPEWDPRAAIHPGVRVPLLVTRVGQENAGLVEGQQQFLDKAARLDVPTTVIDVPNGRHAFDAADPTPESQNAVRKAAHWVLKNLNAR